MIGWLVYETRPEALRRIKGYHWRAGFSLLNNTACEIGDSVKLQTFIVKLLANKSFNIARRNQEITNGFCNACKHGHLEIAQMLLNEFDFTLNKVQCNNLFILTSANGHLDVAKWLVDVLYLKEEDVKSNNNNALVFACANGHLEIVKWLIHKFLSRASSEDDHDFNDNLPFEYACKNGHVKIDNWMLQNGSLIHLH